MSIKYYHLAKDEEPPDEFCAVRDIDGEPSEYTWYEREVCAPERGTCRVMTIGEFNGEATEYYDICSNCCYEFDDDPLNYCPNCGRRIEVDG